jgi:hypothetical protein
VYGAASERTPWLAAIRSNVLRNQATITPRFEALRIIILYVLLSFFVTVLAARQADISTWK